MQITTIGLDLAKSVFQVHGVDATGQVAKSGSVVSTRWATIAANCWTSITSCGGGQTEALALFEELVGKLLHLRGNRKT